MKNTKKAAKNIKPEPDIKSETKNQKTPTKFGVLGKDLSSRYAARGDRAWRPTKPGGRNGNGKPT